MYWNERDHPVAHFHAEYAGKYASVAFDGALLAGSLPAKELRLIEDWVRLHQDELLANWQCARNHEPLAPIDPLS